MAGYDLRINPTWQGQPGLAGLAGFWQGILEPASWALAGFETWAESCGEWCVIRNGHGAGMVRAWVGNISATPFKRILRPISARLRVRVRVGVGVAKKAPIKGLKGGFFGVYDSLFNISVFSRYSKPSKETPSRRHIRKSCSVLSD
jgi:hypothetical protein